MGKTDMIIATAQTFIFAYIAYFYFQMGRNKVAMYSNARDRMVTISTVFNLDWVHYISSTIMFILIGRQLVEVVVLS